MCILPGNGGPKCFAVYIFAFGKSENVRPNFVVKLVKHAYAVSCADLFQTVATPTTSVDFRFCRASKSDGRTARNYSSTTQRIGLVVVVVWLDLVSRQVGGRAADPGTRASALVTVPGARSSQVERAYDVRIPSHTHTQRQ